MTKKPRSTWITKRREIILNMFFVLYRIGSTHMATSFNVCARLPQPDRCPDIGNLLFPHQVSSEHLGYSVLGILPCAGDTVNKA